MHHLSRIALFCVLFMFTLTVRAEHAATQMLEGVANRLINKIETNKQRIDSDPNYIVSIVDEIIMPVTDFELIGKRVLGRHWRNATPAQREQFLKEFELLLIVTYMAAFRSYEDQTVDFVGERNDPNNPDRVEVRTLIKEGGAAPIPVNYRLHLVDGNWKVYDFNVDGVGLTSSFRSQFNNAINQKGLPTVLADMRQKNNEVFNK